MVNKKRTIKASVTLYLSICVSLILSLVCYTIESCRLDGQICHAEGISYISTDSLMSHYCLPLFSEYGVFALNEQGINLVNYIKEYADKNCQTKKGLLWNQGSLLDIDVSQVDIKKYTYITDKDGEIFANQILNYILLFELDTAIEQLFSIANTDSPEIFSQTEEGIPDINFNNIDTSTLDQYIDKQIERTGETNEDLSKVNNATFLPTITYNITHHIKHGLLATLVPDTSSVSTATIDKVILPSVTCPLSQEGIETLNGYHKDITAANYEKAAFCEYIHHTFGNYTTPSKNSPLKYEIEYIISGQDSDDSNLLNTACQLISFRTGLNLIHLLSDNNKFNAAWAIASSVSTIPGLSYLLQGTILTVWACAESIIDVKDLLSGKNVPLFKSNSQWNLSIEGLLNFSKNSSSKNVGAEGLPYSRYLEILLATQNPISLRYRTMDLIQMNLCHKYNEEFRISKCVTGIEGTIAYKLPSLFSRKTYTYKCTFNLNYQ